MGIWCFMENHNGISAFTLQNASNILILFNLPNIATIYNIE